MTLRAKDITGVRFGRLLAIKQNETIPVDRWSSARWDCVCDCGTMVTTTYRALHRKVSQPKRSCGCLVKNRKRKHATKEIARLANIAAARRRHKEKPEVYRAYQRQWCRNNLYKFAQKTQRRNARKRKQSCTCCSTKQLNTFYAGRLPGMEVDHIYPLSKGGAHCVKNFQYLTQHENRSKGARLIAA